MNRILCRSPINRVSSWRIQKRGEFKKVQFALPVEKTFLPINSGFFKDFLVNLWRCISCSLETRVFVDYFSWLLKINTSAKPCKMSSTFSYMKAVAALSFLPPLVLLSFWKKSRFFCLPYKEELITILCRKIKMACPSKICSQHDRRDSFGHVCHNIPPLYPILKAAYST